MGKLSAGSWWLNYQGVNVVDVWKEIRELCNQVERLGQLIALKAGGFNLNCQVCGYQLKAQKAFSKFLHTSVVMGPGLDASDVWVSTYVGMCE